ncbi:hypothetical protein ACIBCA_25455 [Kitasatospora sp. NPDC051170]|uniref:hypothetical protein n=1 Tax=Kitasatospora sp. NPDC051170 TaxID=3364056 RepID=UPI00379ADE97
MIAPDPFANAIAATHYAIAASINTVFPLAAMPVVPDDFDWPELDTLVHHLGFVADESDAAQHLYRLLFAVHRIAYREGAGRNSPWLPTRLNPRETPEE